MHLHLRLPKLQPPNNNISPLLTTAAAFSLALGTSPLAKIISHAFDALSNIHVSAKHPPFVNPPCINIRCMPILTNTWPSRGAGFTPLMVGYSHAMLLVSNTIS